LLYDLGLILVHAEIVSLEGTPFASLAVGIHGSLAGRLVTTERSNKTRGVTRIRNFDRVDTVSARGSILLYDLGLILVHAEIVSLEGTPFASLAVGIHGSLAGRLVTTERSNKTRGITRIRNFKLILFNIFTALDAHLLRHLHLVVVEAKVVFLLEGTPFAGIAFRILGCLTGIRIASKRSNHARGITRIGYFDFFVFDSVSARGSILLHNLSLVDIHTKVVSLEGAPIARLAIYIRRILAGRFISTNRDNKTRGITRIGNTGECFDNSR